MKLNVLNMAGKKAGTVEVDSSLFGCEFNEALVHQVVVAQLANKRSSRTKEIRARKKENVTRNKKNGVKRSNHGS